MRVCVVNMRKTFSLLSLLLSTHTHYHTITHNTTSIYIVHSDHKFNAMGTLPSVLSDRVEEMLESSRLDLEDGVALRGESVRDSSLLSSLSSL